MWPACVRNGKQTKIMKMRTQMELDLRYNIARGAPLATWFNQSMDKNHMPNEVWDEITYTFIIQFWFLVMVE